MSQVSIFSNISVTKNPENIDLESYLIDTRDGRWEDLVSECRAIKDDAERREFKKTMPTTTLSGIFKTRRDDGLIEHSGYISIDLDHVEKLNKIKSALKLDKYVYSVFMSTSGDGLRVLFKIAPDKHRESFLGISKYLLDRYEIVSDPNGINISKPYIVSYDPDLYININECPVFRIYPKETKIKKIVNFVHTPSDFEEVYKNVIGRNISICEEYSDWLKLCFAISEEFGEGGRDYFHALSQCSGKYKHSIADKQYTYCLRAKGSGVGISTFYYLARESGVKIVSEQTKTIYRVTTSNKKAGLSKEQVIANLAKFENITGVEKVVDDIWSKNDDFFDSEEESILDTLEIFISNNYNLRENEITGYLENHGRKLSENDMNSIFITAKKLIPKLDFQLMVRLLKSDFTPKYNPFFEFFGSDGIPAQLPEIPDGEQPVFETPLLDELAACIINDNPAFTQYFLKKWVVSIISSAHKVHSPLLLCLLGAQNTGKTEFFRRLLPKELMDYYAESKLDKEKDDELLMTENLVILDDELGGKSKREENTLKTITSKQYFSLRRPYGTHNEKILRLAVLCGTTNLTEIITDTTGNRRIIPIDVEDIDKRRYNAIDKKELFLEAFKVYKEGFDWRMSKADIEYMKQCNTKYESHTFERELLNKYFAPDDSKFNTKLSSTEMIIELEIFTKKQINMITLGKELTSCGFIKKTVREIDGSFQRKWGVKRINRENPTDATPTTAPDEEAPF